MAGNFGKYLYLFHIYIGPVYQGCIEAKNKTHAMSMWAKSKGIGQIILRAELAENVPPKPAPLPNKVKKRMERWAAKKGAL